jgi:hypothetical protein
MHINRASIVYGIMILASIAGVWAVLAVGKGLMPPEDLAGKWSLESRLGPNRPEIQEAALGPGMTVDQSGKFFQVSFENGPKLNLELSNQSNPNASETQVALVGEPWRLTFQGVSGGDDMEVHLVGPNLRQCGVWNARRVVRKFAPDVSDKGVH